MAHQDGMNAILRYSRPTVPCNALVKTIYETQQKVHFVSPVKSFSTGRG